MPDGVSPYHRNRKFTVPRIGDGGAGRLFKRSDFLQGRTQARFGDAQSLDVLQRQEVPQGQDGAEPALWPQDWPKSGKLLNVPRVVIFSSLPCWPEFWGTCEFDFVRDVIGSLLTDPTALGNYYYMEQWDVGEDRFLGGEDRTGDWRYARTVCTLDGIYASQHRRLLDTFAAAAGRLRALDDPIYAIVPQWMPRSFQNIFVGNIWSVWSRHTAYWDEVNECHPDASIPGFSQCDIYTPKNHRSRVHPDPDCADNSSDTDPPQVPLLMSGEPYFGTNVLHCYVGHFALNHGGRSSFQYESWPASPAGLQIGPVVGGTYLGNPNPFFAGRRVPWRDLGLDYGYMDSATNNPTGKVSSLLDHYSSAYTSAANVFKENFWKFRDFGLRVFQYPEPWGFSWNPQAIFADQKWCAAQQFYFGLTFDEFKAIRENEDIRVVDWSMNHDGLKLSNVLTLFPVSESIRQAISRFFPPISRRVEAYYNGIEPGTRQFMDGVIARCGLDDYNVAQGDTSGVDIFDPDFWVQYVLDYFGGQT